MFALLRPLLVIYAYLQLPGGDASSNEFHYQDINTGNGNRESTYVCVRVYVFLHSIEIINLRKLFKKKNQSAITN